MKNPIDFLSEWAEDANWKIFLINKAISDEDVINIEDLATDILNIITRNINIKPNYSVRSQNNTSKLIIKEIKNPTNINALYNMTSFSLGNKLNVLYGETGSGKSSYTRIFRKISNHYFTKLKNLSVLQNVYESNHDGIQQIKISYVYNNTLHADAVININEKHDDLCHINVFDSDSIIALLNDDLSFSILPHGFIYFNKVITLLDTLKYHFEKVISEMELEKTRIFKDSSYDNLRDDIKNILTKTNQNTDFVKFLTTHYNIPNDFSTQIEKADKSIKDLETLNSADTITLVQTQKSKLESIEKGIKDLSDKICETSINNINKLIDEYERVIKEEKALNQDLSKKLSFLNIINDEWLNFIRSAKNIIIP